MVCYRTFSVLCFILMAAIVFSQSPKAGGDYLVRVASKSGAYGYADLKGNMVIAKGKYEMCFTEKFKTYAIVAKKDSGLIGIDRQENVLYEVFNYDNGPDEPVNGLFRITVNKKIGYADAATGKIVIQPQFDCAFPFVNGVATVSTDCKTKAHGEHSEWLSDHWFYINKKGEKVKDPKLKAE